MVDGRFYGLASQCNRPKNGSQIRSRKPAVGNKLPAISFVTGTGPMVRSSSEGFDQWAFAIDQRRRALLGKMDMLKGRSVRSAGNALTTLLCSASAASVTCCYVHEILQWGSHASIPGEGCTGLARRRSRRAHSLSPNPGRAASPICPDLIYDRHNPNYDKPVAALFD